MPSTQDGYTYSQAKAKLNGKVSKVLSANTMLIEQTNGSIGVMLHGSKIIELQSDGGIRLNPCGYASATTKSRMNSYLSAVCHLGRVSISQRDGFWLVHRGGHTVASIKWFESRGNEKTYSPKCVNELFVDAKGNMYVGGEKI